jgi:pimeloyl-ACP methyl ester carboxylesterase
MLPIRVGPYRAEAHQTENARYAAPLVFVHGLWVGGWCWRSFAGFLAHRGWEAIAPDLRGRPDSRPAALRKTTLADYVEDVVSIVEARGGITPILVGHAVGGLVALEAARRISCRAVVALAPPLPGAIRPALREILGRRAGWLDRRVPPPAEIEGLGPVVTDSPRVATALVGGDFEVGPLSVPVRVVAFAAEAERRGWSHARRAAGHWDLSGRGFERQVDPIHRWLVRELGGELLRLSGFEDLEEDEDDG